MRQPRRRRQPVPRPRGAPRPGGRAARRDRDGAARRASCWTRSRCARCARCAPEVGALSGGQRQSVAIARALLGEPRLVILDEPTAALGVAQTEQVLALVKRLRERGLGVILISHNLADVFEVADRIVVLRLGRNAASSPRSPSTHEKVVAAITGVGGDGSRPTPRRRRHEHDAPDAAEAVAAPVDDGRAAASACATALRKLLRGRARLAARPGRARRSSGRSSRSPTTASSPRSTSRTSRCRSRPSARSRSASCSCCCSGEIDLSVGAVSGLRGGRHGRPCRSRTGWARARRSSAGSPTAPRSASSRARSPRGSAIPSFVVTLAGLLGWQGALLLVLGDTGTVNLTDPGITNLTGTFLRRRRRLGRGGWRASPRSRSRRCSSAGGGSPPGWRPSPSACSGCGSARSAVGDLRRRVRSSTPTAACRWRC